MPHLDCCVPVAVPAIHPIAEHSPQIDVLGFESKGNGQKQQQTGAQQGGGTKEEQKTTIGGGRRKGAAPKGRMCEPITEDSLTQFQLDKLRELRAKLGEQLLQETPLFNDNFSLLRWLHGWNYRIDEILPRFKKASSIFRCMRVSDRLIEDIDALNDFTRTLTDAADFFPGGVLGYDREGNVVVMQMMGQSHPRQLSRCGRVSDVYRLSIVETALLYQLIRLQESKRHRKLGLRVIIDLEGFNSDHVTTFGLKVYGALLKAMQDMFPDMLRQVYVINAHYLVKTAYTIIKPVLSEQSREKVIFLDSAFHEQLAKDIGAENLFPKWGGRRNPARGHPEWGTLRGGGVPPTNLRYSPATHPNMADGLLKKIAVPARQRREIEVKVPSRKGGAVLRWFWTSSSDVDFGIVTEDNKEVWPMFRLLTDFVPEYGVVGVEAGRTYKFVFDNSFSVFSRKEIKFGYKLDEEKWEEEGARGVEGEGKKAEGIEEDGGKMMEDDGMEEKVEEEKENDEVGASMEIDGMNKMGG